MRQDRDISAWDGLAVHVTEWDGGTGVPLLCLPGLVRTGGDFEGVAARHGAGRRVVTLDYIGRGASARARRIARYAPEAMLRDVMDVCAAVHLHRAVVIGTSFGGLLAMALGAARPGLLAGVVLNDVGPEIGTAGAEQVRCFVAGDPALPDIDAAAAYLAHALPDLSLHGEADWRDFTALTYAPGPDGRWHPLWDTRIARTMAMKPPDLWPLFGALAGVKLLLVHGGRSTLLTDDTVARMRVARPDMVVATVPGSGHAPTLAEPEAMAALAAFLPCIPARWVASFLGSGLAPVSPGTVGSLAALLPGLALLWLSHAALGAGVLVVVALGLWAVRAAGATGDPGWVVIDEVAGQWIALLALAHPSVFGALAAFAAFRLFDVTKPGPIGWAERLPGAVGVMADDVLAGALAAVLVWGLRWLLPGWLD